MEVLRWLQRAANCASTAYVLFGVDAMLTAVILWLVPYTEIDWVAYMQEVEGFLGGDTDYKNLKGQTGPLVYPAGFVYLYSLLYLMTDQGRSIWRAQWIFYFIYLGVLGLVLAIYSKSRSVPPWFMIFLILSKRIHSIFVLRCFNDGVAMLFLYLAVFLFIKDRWRMGCFWFSIAVSIKMNILLFAPGLGVLLLQRYGWRATLPCLWISAVVQLILGWPFLSTFPWSYVNGAFDLRRQFQYQWTVNWRFLSEPLFLDRRLAAVMLLLHLALLVAFCQWRWCKCGVQDLLWCWRRDTRLSAQHVLAVLFCSNFLGISVARSLHYQFYAWYFHSVPLLLWMTPLRAGVKVLCLLLIEGVWNVFPATALSSATLLLAHTTLLWGLWNADYHAELERKTT